MPTFLPIRIGGWGIVEGTRQWHSDQSWPTDMTYICTNRLFSSAGRTINLGRKAFRTWLIVRWLMRWRDLVPDLNKETWEKRWGVINVRSNISNNSQQSSDYVSVDEMNWGMRHSRENSTVTWPVGLPIGLTSIPTGTDFLNKGFRAGGN